MLFDLFRKKDSADEEDTDETDEFEEDEWESDEDDEDDDEYGERISVWDAADIWLSSGKDEDYMFGYTEEELEEAAK